jgi:hypothetical protein
MTFKRKNTQNKENKANASRQSRLRQELTNDQARLIKRGDPAGQVENQGAGEECSAVRVHVSALSSSCSPYICHASVGYILVRIVQLPRGRAYLLRAREGNVVHHPALLATAASASSCGDARVALLHVAGVEVSDASQVGHQRFLEELRVERCVVVADERRRDEARDEARSVVKAASHASKWPRAADERKPFEAPKTRRAALIVVPV